MQRSNIENKKIISVFILSLLVAFSVSVSFFAGARISYAATGCYCEPNLAVFPNGHDPSCVNHVYVGNDPAFCGGASSAVNGSATTNSFSCNPGAVTDFKSLIMNLVVGCFYYLVVRIIIGLALVFFLWGIFKIIRASGKEDKDTGKQFILWGIIGLFVIFSVMGIVNILQSTFRLNTSSINMPR